VTFTTEQTALLNAKLDPSVVRKNPKGHDYIEGWRAIAEANRIFGHDGWAREMASLAQVAEPYKGANDNWRVAYRAVVRVTVYAGERVLVREGTGYGSGIAKDLNDAHESAVKEAETDAMKRALMTFGNPFGLALYDKERANVGFDPPPLPESAQRMLADLAAVTKGEQLAEWLTRNKAAVKAYDEATAGPVMDAYYARKDELVRNITQAG
jgi:DNA repair and recombination protein RAD52